MIVIAATGHNPFQAFKGIFNGTGLNWLFPWVTGAERVDAAFNLQQTLIYHDGADPARLRRLVRVQVRPVQHRRPGPVHRSAPSSPSGSARPLPQVGHDRTGSTGCTSSWLIAVVLAALAGAAWAAIAGFLKATVGVHEVISTIMLNWVAYWVAQALVGQGGQLQNTGRQVGPGLQGHRPGRPPAGLLGRPGAPGPARRLLHRARRAGRLLAHPQPDDARLRGAGDRLQPGGGPLRRHQRQAQLRAGDGDLGHVRRARRRDRHPRLAVPARRRSTSRSRTIGFIGIAVALLGRNSPIGVPLAALLFGAL